MLTETEYEEYVAAGRGGQPDVHPLCLQLRALRRATGLSLADFEARSGIKGVVLGAYERGDRVPPLHKLDSCFRFFGYQLAAVPTDSQAVRTPVDLVGDLRAIADQVENYGLPPASDE